MKKKLILGILAIAMSASVLVACGSDSAGGAAADTQSDVSGEATEATEDSVTDVEVPEENDYNTVPMLSELNMDEYITLGEYKGLQVSGEVTEPTDEQIQKRIDNELSALSSTETVTGRAVQEGDIVNIDYVGKKDGVAFDGGTASGYDLTIGSGQFIPGFESGLIGTNTGDTVDLNLTFPEQYHSEELAGAEVVFTVTVNEIKQKVEPELTDEVVSQLDERCKTVEEYKKSVATRIKEEEQEDLVAQQKEELMKAAVDNATVKEIPGWLVRERIDYMKKSAESYASSYGLTFEEFLTQALGQTEQEFMAECENYAKDDAKETLVVYAIADKEGLKLSEDKLKEQMTSYAEATGEPSVEEFMKSVEGRVFESYMQRDAVVGWLLDNASLAK